MGLIKNIFAGLIGSSVGTTWELGPSLAGMAIPSIVGAVIVKLQSFHFYLVKISITYQKISVMSYFEYCRRVNYGLKLFIWKDLISKSKKILLLIFCNLNLTISSYSHRLSSGHDLDIHLFSWENSTLNSPLDMFL